MDARQINAKSLIATAALALSALTPSFAFAWGSGDQTELPAFATSANRSAPLATFAWGPGDQTEFAKPVFATESSPKFMALTAAGDPMQEKAIATVLNKKTRMQVLDELKMVSDAERMQHNVN